MPADPPDARRTTQRLSPDPAGIARAAALLRAGRTVAFPTETVYGLGARADDPAAVAAIYAAKGRPSFNPLIVHVPDAAAAARLADWPAAGDRLAAAFWPGPLTLVGRLRPGAGLAPAVMAGLPTVAVRVPGLPLARRLLAEAGVPVAAPSANRSGRVSPTTAAHVLDELDGRIAAVLDGGPCPVGVESAIVGFDADGEPVLLRPGGVSAEALAEALGRAPATPHPPTRAAGARPTAAAPPVTSPGQLASHYAPGAALRLDADRPRPGEAWLGFGPDPVLPPGTPARSLSTTGDPAEAAATLYAALRALDALTGGQGTIAVAPIPTQGLGAAVADRLRRAAAPRDAPRDAPRPDAREDTP